MYIEKDFIKAISQSFKKYIEHGSRSTEKLKPIHNYVAQTLQKIFGDIYELHFLSDETTEMKVKGKYYDKNIDITVAKDNRPIICLGIKFVTSNYKQNANNYFENMMGETANIQSCKDLPYFQLIILRHQTPYYSKTTQRTGTKEPAKIEIIKEHDLQKYINLAYDTPHAHKPYAMGILLIELEEKTSKVEALKPNLLFDKEFAKLFESKLSVENFFVEIENYKNYIFNK
ncbi:hypothetical protein D9V86_00535 [Bacteroidetes/Chlorobi group bacterium ChocPot_Mid]|nr:MAG: hypothetical protein D9V86_00535 [Bacteroidetes/Chlorobi group bacterium ChocPot_Mid]